MALEFTMIDLNLEISEKDNAGLAEILNEAQNKNLLPTRNLIGFCCRRVGWYGLSEGYGDWNYPHCLTTKGGVIPYSFRGLINALKGS